MARPLKIPIIVDDSKVSPGLRRTETKLAKFGKKLSTTTSGTVLAAGGTKGLGGLAGGASFALAAGFGTKKALDFARAASDLEEQINKSDVVFGKASKAVIEFGKNSATSFGIAETDAISLAGTFGALFRPMGFGIQEAQKQSVALVKLGSDLASFYNTDVASALEALRAGITGQIRPLRRYGVDLSKARIEAQALADTGKETASSLTTQEKTSARLAIIFRDTSLAQGDFARTSDRLANQERILTAQTKDLETRLGSVLLPTLTGIVTQLNDAATAAEELGTAFENSGKQGEKGGSSWVKGLKNIFESNSYKQLTDFIKLTKSGTPVKFGESPKTTFDRIERNKQLAAQTPEKAAQFEDFFSGLRELTGVSRDTGRGLREAGSDATSLGGSARDGASGIRDLASSARSGAGAVSTFFEGLGSLSGALTAKAGDITKPTGPASFGEPGFKPSKEGTPPTRLNTRLQSAIIDAQQTAGTGDDLKALGDAKKFLENALTDVRLKPGQITSLKQELAGITGDIKGINDGIVQDVKDKKDAVDQAREQFQQSLTNLSGTAELKAALAAATPGQADDIKSLRGQLVEWRKKLAKATSDGIRSQIVGQINTVTDSISQIFKDQGEAIKSAALAMLDTKQTKIQNQRDLEDAKKKMAVARMIGGPEGIKLAARDLQDVNLNIERQKLEDTTFKTTAGKTGNVSTVSVGSVVIHINGAQNPQQIATEVLKVLQKRGKHGSTQQRGTIAGRNFNVGIN